MKQFIQIMKNLRSKCYSNQLVKMMNLPEKKIVLFYPFFSGGGVNNFINYFQHFKIPLNFICVPDRYFYEFKSPDGIQKMKLSHFLNSNEKNNMVLFVNPDFTSFKFWELFNREGIQNVISIGNPQFYLKVYDILFENMESIYKVYQALNANDGSRDVYAASLYGKVSNCVSELVFNDGSPYFLSGFLPEKGDIIIDGGAYDGRTAEEFTSLGGKVYSFEMDEKNYLKGKQRANRFAFTLEKMGLGSKKGTVKYSAYDIASRVDAAGTLTAEIIDLDTYVEKNSLPRVDFIKLDIEGSELEALRGAMSTISKWKPKMSICMYHKLEDMWTIPLYIKSLHSDYEFSFRHHLIDARFETLIREEDKNLLDEYGLDYFLKSQDETVLYCK